MTRTLARFRVAVLLFVSVVTIVGCGTSRTDSLDTATAGVGETRDMLATGSEQVDAVVMALQAMMPPRGDQDGDQPVDLKKAFDQYRKEVNRLEEVADKVRARHAAMEARLEEHITTWEAELANISSDRAREISDRRRAELGEVLVKLGETLEMLKEDYDPFVSILRDIELVLANDLSVGGVAAVEPLMTDAVSEGQEVKESIQRTQEALADAIAEFQR
jgi:hypothetical protein